MRTHSATAARQFRSWCTAWLDETGLIGVADGMGRTHPASSPRREAETSRVRGLVKELPDVLEVVVRERNEAAARRAKLTRHVSWPSSPGVSVWWPRRLLAGRRCSGGWARRWLARRRVLAALPWSMARLA